MTRQAETSQSDDTLGFPTDNQVVEFRRILLEWYAVHGRSFTWRDASATTYAKVVAEILLQRTRADTVQAFLPIFLTEFPAWEAVAHASVERIQEVLRPVGLWRRRSLSLLGLGREMSARGGWFNGDRAEIEALPGVGQYVASAIMLVVCGRPEPLLDANMARVLERNFGPRKYADIRHDPYLQRLARRVVDCPDPLAMNWAILDLAALVCVSRVPRCSFCPLSVLCLSSNA